MSNCKKTILSTMIKSFGSRNNLKRKNLSQQDSLVNKKVILHYNDNVLENLKVLKKCFDNITFKHKMPAILFQHQLYSFSKNRTLCDKEVMNLSIKGEIKVFKTGIGEYNNCILFAKDFTTFVSELYKETENEAIVEKFLREITMGKDLTSLSVDQDKLFSFGFKDEDITTLIKCGLLTVRDAGTWWLAIPRMGYFMQLYSKGKQAFIKIIKSTMKNEVFMSEILSRKCPKSIVLGLLYHTHDAIGSEKVLTMETTSGLILKLPRSQ